MDDCCATSRYPRRSIALRARAEAAQTWPKHGFRRPCSGFRYRDGGNYRTMPMTARCAGATNPVALGTASVIPPRMTREQVAVKGIPRDQLRGVPDIGQDELIRFFTLTPADVEFVASRRARGPAQGLGLAVQLCTLPWLGFVPDEVRAAPPVAVARLGARLKVDPGVLACYGAREQTRTDHLLAVTDFLGWKSAPAAGVAAKELEEFVACRDRKSTRLNSSHA